MKKQLTSSVVLTLTLLIANPSFANNCTTVEDIKSADANWQHMLATHQANKIEALYTPHAVLLATFRNEPLTTQEQRLSYFKYLFKTMSELSVTFNQEIPQIFSGGAISSGIYTFTGVSKGKPSDVIARYTFVYQASPLGCQLIAHHSSVLPEENKTPTS